MTNLKRYNVSWVDPQLVEHCGCNSIVQTGQWDGSGGPYVDGTSESMVGVICLRCGERGQLNRRRDNTIHIELGGEVIDDGQPIKVGYCVLAGE